MTKQDLVALARGLAPFLRDLSSRVSQLEVKERGLDGAQGPAGPEGKPGRDGLAGLPGRDGKDGSNGKDGQDGVPGRDGLDGFGFDDLQVLHDGERVMSLRFIKGDRVKDFPVMLTHTIYRGVFSAGTTYETGDEVTWAGGRWIARETTTQKPGDGATSWQLTVKPGRDGRDGKPGERGVAGPKGDKGDPGRNFS